MASIEASAGEQPPMRCVSAADRKKPILRWAGSKFRILSPLLRASAPQYRRYFEPFAGSACLFLALEPSRGVLGDINRHLIGAYRTIRARPHAVFNALSKLPRTKQHYYRIRRIVPDDLNAIDRAARFVYLNQFCFNGVYRENRAGEFNVPRGRKFRKFPTQESYIQFADRLRSVELRCADFESCLEDVQKHDFVYLDPPYAKYRGRNRGEYGRDAFCEEDIERLISVMRTLDRQGAQVMTSFFDSQRLRRSLSNWNIASIEVPRSVSGFVAERKSVRELIFCNYDR